MANTTSEALIGQLVAEIGKDAVLTGEEDRRWFSMDISGQGTATAAAVACPSTVEQLARVVAVATAAGHAVIARGGGASYTRGFVPDTDKSVVIDTRKLDRVVDIDAASMHVTVEAGCTWKALTNALAAQGLRTPFWGPLSGSVATVGGSVSQNAILWGSARYGVSAESVVGIDVVLADGTLLALGAGAARGATPFLRNFGPDLTGLFLGDCGALGVKARITLKLIPAPAAVLPASFGFDDRNSYLAALGEVAREGLATECFGMDPVLQKQRLKRGSVKQGIKALQGVVASQGLLSGLKDVAKVAIAGRDFLDDVNYSMHVCTEGRDEAAASSALAAIRRIVAAKGGREVPDSVPKLMRGAQYVPMSSSIGPLGERWLPVHALVPLGDAAGTWNAVQALFDEHAKAFEKHGIEVGVLSAVVGSGAMALEPVFYWQAPRTLYYKRVLDEAATAGFTDFPPNPEGEALVFEVRGKLSALFSARGCSHLQLGRTYPYRAGITPAAWALLVAIKKSVDPAGLMNPGVLGL